MKTELRQVNLLDCGKKTVKLIKHGTKEENKTRKIETGYANKS